MDIKWSSPVYIRCKEFRGKAGIFYHCEHFGHGHHFDSHARRVSYICTIPAEMSLNCAKKSEKVRSVNWRKTVSNRLKISRKVSRSGLQKSDFRLKSENWHPCTCDKIFGNYVCHVFIGQQTQRACVNEFRHKKGLIYQRKLFVRLSNEKNSKLH